MNSFVVAISGGSGSGKTTFAKRVMSQCLKSQVTCLFQDSYYRDQSARFNCDGGNVNFDHPSALEFELLAEHLQALKKGESVCVPQYDFATHSRLKVMKEVIAKPLVLLDGTLVLSQEMIRKEINYAIFIDVDEELRFSRRLARDVRERGRSEEGVRVQFQEQVKPMHDQFVEPSIEYADMVVKADDFDEKLTEFLEYLEENIFAFQPDSR